MLIQLLKKTFLFTLRGMVAIIPIFLIVYATLGVYKFFQELFPEISLVYIAGCTFLTFFVLGLILTYQLPNGIKYFIKRRLAKKSNFNFPFRVSYRVVRLLMKEGKIFDQPVWIIDDSDNRTVGFITSDNLEHFDAPDHVTVFVPQPFSLGGGLSIVPKSKCVPITKNKEHVLTLVLSGGLSKDIHAEFKVENEK